MGRLITKIKGAGGLILSAAVLVISLSIALSTIFGWFAIRNDPVQQPFQVVVVGGVQASLEIDGNQYATTGLSLKNIAPGEEYEFKITISPSEAGFIRVYFVNPSGAFSDNGISGNMSDIMGVKVTAVEGVENPEEFKQEDYTPISEMEEEGYIIVDDIPLSSSNNIIITFALRFLSTPPDGKDLNIYQGRQFNIDTLVIERYLNGT
ncbi:MAG: hypothetical protein WC292_01090 [Clostridia bacterium]